MIEDRLPLIRRYAEGSISWGELRNLGMNYLEVLAGLGELGLRPPIFTGPPVDETHARGRAMLADALARLDGSRSLHPPARPDSAAQHGVMSDLSSDPQPRR